VKLWDVVVIGAGVAGSTAAGLLSDECSVLLLDPDPFNKTCAGILTADYTRRYGVNKSCIERTLKGVKIYYRGNEVTIPYTKNTIEYSINRKLFDTCNFNQALDSGTEYRAWSAEYLVETDDCVKVKTSRQTIYADYAIVACGLSKFSQRIAPAKTIGYCVQKRVDGVVDDYFQIHFGYHRGYTWLSPKSTYSLVGSGSPDGYPNIPLYKNYNSPIMQGVIPYSGPVKTTATKRTVLVGDTAGFVTPLEGEGIYYARRSAELAAETIRDNSSPSVKECQTFLLRRKSAFYVVEKQIFDLVHRKKNTGLKDFERKWKSEFNFTPYQLYKNIASDSASKAFITELQRNDRLKAFIEALLTKKDLRKTDYLKILPALLKIGILSYFTQP